MFLSEKEHLLKQIGSQYMYFAIYMYMEIIVVYLTDLDISMLILVT